MSDGTLWERWSEVDALLEQALDRPPAERESFLTGACEGDRELYWIPNAGHTEWMFDDHPTFIGLVEHIDGWVRRKLG